MIPETGFKLEKWPNKSFFTQNMTTKKYNKLRNIAGFSIFVAVLLIGTSGRASEKIEHFASIEDGTVSSNFMIAANPVLEHQEIEIFSVPQIMQDTFMVANGSTEPTPTTRSTSARAGTVMYVTSTGYSSTPDQTDDSPFVTANGTWVYDGVIAANFLPFKTKVKIPELYGDKMFTVEDKMNRRYPNRMDIWFPDRESAIQFGKRRVKIEII